MLYPENIEQKLGFDQVRELIKKECLSSLGEYYVDKISFSTDTALVKKLIAQTDEFKKMLMENVNFPASHYIDAKPYFDKIKPEGAFLEPSEFLEIKLSLHTIIACLEFFDKQEDIKFPSLKALAKEIVLDRQLYKEIDRKISDEGLVRDNASRELQEVRKKMITEQGRLRRELDRILKHAKQEGYTEEGAGITIRNGRMVIPVSAENKRKVKGFVHDESATGQTVFIEPAEILEINNEIIELQYQERREIVKILVALSNEVRPQLLPLRKAYTFLGLIDFIGAKAKFARRIQAVKPVVEEEPIIKWQRARHPLLFIALQKLHKTIIPLDIEINEENRLLIISGPNAGGKSVCLKTTGLIQYMFQCGLLAPVEEHSHMGFFNDVFIDIGDEQSIENDLSTYSSHLKNMKQFLSFAGNKSLILIDEFGTGTEPQFGAAIAEAVLEGLVERKAFGLITTHYGNLKAYADKTEGVVNGAMRYDLKNLEPLYQLEIGRPGSSFAFEIARKIGLPEAVIQRSREKIDSGQLDMEKLLRDLEAEKNRLSRQNEEMRRKDRELSEKLKEYTERTAYLEANNRKLMNEAKDKAKQLVADANQKIESTIRDIKESKADKEITKLLREDLKTFTDTLRKEQEPEQSKIVVEQGEIKAGDLVRLKDNGAVAEVVAIKGRDADILIGELKSNVKMSRLEKISRKEYRLERGVENKPAPSINLSEKMGNFSPNVDLRGKRGEEALHEVDQLIDSALLFGVPEVHILHGKGDGILRTLIRNHLKNYKQVQSMADEHADRGGAGVTIVKLK